MVVILVLDDVDMVLEVPGVLKLVEEFVEGRAVELPVKGGRVLDVTGVVVIDEVVLVVPVVANVAGILQSVAGPTPVLGCFGVPGGMVRV